MVRRCQSFALVAALVLMVLGVDATPAEAACVPNVDAHCYGITVWSGTPLWGTFRLT
jgi:hypothetical protein